MRMEKKKLYEMLSGRIESRKCVQQFSFNFSAWLTFSCISQRRIPDRGLRQALIDSLRVPGSFPTASGGGGCAAKLPPLHTISGAQPKPSQPFSGLAGNTTASTPILICSSTHTGCGEVAPLLSKRLQEGAIDVTLPRCWVRHFGAPEAKAVPLSHIVAVEDSLEYRGP